MAAGPLGDLLTGLCGYYLKVIEDKSVLAVVPARFGSKGLPRKNLMPLAGQPLVAYPVKAALNSKYVDHVFCSTESKEIANLASIAGADITYSRPENLALDQTTSVEVLLDALNYFESVNKTFDFVLMLEPTSPMTDSTDIDLALEALMSGNGEFENLVSIAETIGGHPQFTFRVTEDGSLQPYDKLDWKFKRRQELEQLFFQTGSLYISEVSALKRNKSFISKKTLGFEVPKIKSFEIDDLIDFKIVEMLLLDLKNAGLS